MAAPSRCRGQESSHDCGWTLEACGMWWHRWAVLPDPDAESRLGWLNMRLVSICTHIAMHDGRFRETNTKDRDAFMLSRWIG